MSTPEIPTTTRPNRKPISAKRRRLFRAIAAFGIPLLFFFLVEVALRVVGYGYSNHLLIPAKRNGTDVLITNSKFTYRFFPAEIARHPTGIQIATPKPDNTFRIFVLGESAAMGDPAEEFGICRVIQAMLEHDYPNQRFEVVNTGITAINSFVIRDIARDCLGYQPDLFISYIGNNEVLGPYGPGTVLTPILATRAGILTQIALKKTKLAQVVETISESVLKKKAAEWKGLELFTKNTIAANDPRMEHVRDNFKAMLEDIFGRADAAHVPVIAATVVVNLRDCAPFASLHAQKLSPAERQNFDQFMKLGIAALAEKKYDDAKRSLQSAVAISPRFAEAEFQLAKAQDALNETAEALQNYSSARDDDALHFRADSLLNEKTRSVALEHKNVSLVDLEKECAFGQIPGNNMFHEHVHMNLHGNFVMAEKIMVAVRERLAGTIGASAQPPMTEDECKTRLVYNDESERQVLTKVLARISRAPFESQSSHDRELAHIRERLHALGTEKIDETASLDAVLQKFPGDIYLKRRKSVVLYHSGRIEESIALLQEIAHEGPDQSRVYYNLGIGLSALGRDAEAMANLQRSLDLDPEPPEVNYAMGQIVARLGNYQRGLEIYKAQEKATGKSADAIHSLGMILASKDQKPAALELLKSASELAPARKDFARDYATTANGGAETADARNAKTATQTDQSQDIARRMVDGMQQMAAKKYELAEADFRAAAALSPNDGKVLSELAVCVAVQGRLEESLPIFIRAAELLPDNAPVQNNVGTTLFRLNRDADAITYYERALTIDPGYQAAIKNLKNAKARLAQSTHSQ